MLPLQCGAQKYEWGRPAAYSEVARLAKANGTELDNSKPYAELWMGTHPNCPARLAATGQLLSEWIQQNSACLGNPVLQHFGTVLPFLFKVLSVNKALSIQSHPDKQLAAQLRAQHPHLYADDNHKPEMALAISDDFQALCSFAPLSNILGALDAQPELVQLVGNEGVQALKVAAMQPDDVQKQALQQVFTALMTAPAAAVQAAVTSLVERLRATAAVQPLTGHEALALQLDSQYPGGDVGVLAAFFLNLVCLRAGEALYLGANEPHAYLAGELVECMATSDNVIRAGLTPKFKHADVLCSSLTYNTGVPEILTGRVLVSGPAGSVRVYRPPTEEFEVRQVLVEPVQGDDGSAGLCLAADPGPQLVLVQHGRGTARAQSTSSLGADTHLQVETSLAHGMVLFIPAGTAIQLQAEEPLKLWVSAVNSNFFLLADALAPAAVASPKLAVTNSPNQKRMAHVSAVPDSVAAASQATALGSPRPRQVVA